MKLIVALAFRYLIFNPTRTILLGGALIFASMLAVVFICFTSGVMQNLVDSSAAISGGHVNVAGLFKPHKEKAFQLFTYPERVQSIITAAIPDAESVVARHRMPVRVAHGDKSVVVPAAMGVDITADVDLLRVLRLANSEGGAKGDLQRLKEPNTIVLFARQAERLKVKVGDTVVLHGTTLANIPNAIDATVVAIARDLGLSSAWYAFVNRATMSQLLGSRDDVVSMFRIRLRDIEKTPAAIASVTAALKKEGLQLTPPLLVPDRVKAIMYANQGWTGERLVVSSWEDELWANGWVRDVTEALALSLFVVICLVSGIGVANVALMLAKERTPQVGVLRALGMSRSKVLVQIMVEMLALTSAATLVGIGLGAALSTVLTRMHITIDSDELVTGTMSDMLRFTVDWKLLSMLFVALLVVSAVGAVLGALRAITVEPTVAIRQID